MGTRNEEEYSEEDLARINELSSFFSKGLYEFNDSSINGFSDVIVFIIDRNKLCSSLV